MRLNSSETNDFEFKPDFSKNDAVETKTFDTIIAMANTAGGNIVVGVSEGIPRKITGTHSNEISLENRISQLIQEYVDPPSLNVEIYSIESTIEDSKLIGVEVHREEGKYFGKRSFGRNSTKPSTYTLLLRSNGSTFVVDFQTFISIVLGRGLTGFLMNKDLMQEQVGRAWIGPGTSPLNHQKVSYEFDQLALYCRNYGQHPAEVLWMKSCTSRSELTESDIRVTSGSPSTTIFPNQEHKFLTDRVPLVSPNESSQEIIIWFGFIVRYLAHSKDEGEYGILGTFHRNRIASWSEQTDEWFKPKH
jgi:Putative DNA-binding domain